MLKHTVEELTLVMQALDRARLLLSEEDARLRELYGRRADAGMVAGGPGQTLIGLRELISSTSDTVDHLASAIGFHTAGMHARAALAERRARHPLCMPSGTSRMARPLGEATVQALELVKSHEPFFGVTISTAIDVALAAPEATYPPADWDAWRRKDMERGE